MSEAGHDRGRVARPDLLDLLACPVCGGPLDPVGPGTVGCFAGHRFDRSRRGYLTLLGPRSRTDTGDDAAMVDARAAFLSAGHYAPIVDALRDVVVHDGPVLEVGAGTAYYLGGVLAADPARLGLAIDASKHAARAAARHAAAKELSMLSVVADAWAPLPVRDSAVGCVLSVFGPRNPAETARVLEPGGRFVVVVPQADHLAEIRSPMGMLGIGEGKLERLVEQTGWQLTTRSLRWRLELSAADLVQLAAMGPAARHRTADQLRRAASGYAPGPDARIPVTAAVTIGVLQPDRPGSGRPGPA